MDKETDDMMQAAIREHFADYTIICVAHKLNTIVDFDKVAVIDKGKLAEFASPKALLRDPKSIFAELYRKSEHGSSDAAAAVPRPRTRYRASTMGRSSLGRSTYVGNSMRFTGNPSMIRTSWPRSSWLGGS